MKMGRRVVVAGDELAAVVVFVVATVVVLAIVVVGFGATEGVQSSSSHLESPRQEASVTETTSQPCDERRD